MMIFFSIMFQSSNQEYNSFILPNFLFYYLHSIVICTIYNKWYEQNIRTLWTSYIQYSFNKPRVSLMSYTNLIKED